MKHASSFPRFLSITLLSALLLAGFTCQIHADGQLVWSDEFDGSSINTNHWTFDIGNGPSGLPGWGNNELEYYTSRPENAFVSNGVLHIVAKKESYNGQNYTSAKLKTTGLFSKRYGRFEFRARLPQGQGYWPALWMMPQDSLYGGWAASGEIDVMENKGSDPTTVLGTIHYGGQWPNNQYSHGPSFTFTGVDSVTNFHTYALEWSTNFVKWYVDGQLYETQTSWWSSGGASPAPFDQPFYIMMNLAVGGNFGGNPDTNTIFPGEMQIDYVRVYELVPTPASQPILKVRFGFDEPPGSITSPSDINSGGANVILQMANGGGANADYHGTDASGVGGTVSASRALDFSSNGASQPGNPGPIASTTSSNLGFGTITNFVSTIWFKQNAVMASGANVGPRLFILGGGSPSDTGITNSIGLKFQTANQLYFQLNGITVPATFPTNLPANTWVFVAAVYDGASVFLYEGTDTTPVSQVASAAAASPIDFGSNGSLYIGNRQNRQRSFNGWVDDFRFYTGSGDLNFVESVRLQEVNPTPVSIAIQSLSNNAIRLIWPNGTLQAATNIVGNWDTITGATSPYTLTPDGQQQFHRVKLN
ncbi:family 16 glycosylhydrolase [Pedosphaera parvula]|nr:family 16 glycosylhydrolase [Pedosphaera parvula]